ncbi:MAG TPA: glycosyl hydrolase [Opitutaceae bacterium]
MLAAACGALVPSVAHGAITLGQARLGNVFLTTETVEIPLRCAGDEIAWSVTDYDGNVIEQSSTTPAAGEAVIAPAPGRPGYFELDLTEKSSGAVLSEKTTTFAVLTPFEAPAAEESPFGVQTHFSQYNNPDVMPLLALAGIRHIRDEQYWQSIETSPGTYTFPAKFTNYMAAADALGLSPFITLDWSNPFYDYDNGAFTAPYTDSGRQGYANYAVSLLNQYGSQLKSVEVWNEYNAGTFIKGPATTNKSYYYSLMLRDTYEAVKAVRPDVQVVAGATVPVAHGFLRAVFMQGAMPYLDAISVHPYRGTPSGVEIDIAELRELIKTYNNGVEKPIWASEFSMSVNSPAEQYDAPGYLAQIVTLLLSQKVERVYYYLALDDATFPYRGLLSSATSAQGKYTPHPTYVAYANLIRQLSGTTFHSRHAGTSPSTYAFRFQQAGTPVHVLWAVRPITVDLQTSSPLTVTDMMGGARTLTPVDGIVTLTLTEDVQYVRGPVGAIVEIDNPLLADSSSGFSKTQGLNGWHYGFASVPAGTSYSPAQFQAMTWKIWSGDNYRWVGSNSYNFITPDQVHPTGAWTIRRWVSTIPGTVTLSGEVGRSASQGDGVNIRIFVDGVAVYTRYVAPAESFTYTVPDVVIAAGSTIDFAVDQGSNNSYDATKFTAMVSRQP